MTRLAQQLVEAGLRDTPGWQMAQAQQQEPMQLREGVTEYRTK